MVWFTSTTWFTWEIFNRPGLHAKRFFITYITACKLIFFNTEKREAKFMVLSYTSVVNSVEY